jgi:hypothetical protein
MTPDPDPTPGRLAELERLATDPDLTPGPWEFMHEKTEPPAGVYLPRRQVSVWADAAGEYVVPPVFDTGYALPADLRGCHTGRAADFALIAAAHPGTVLALLARVRELEAENARLRAELHPPGRYRCGCPVVRSDRVRAFCDSHHAVIDPDTVPAPEARP